MPLNKQPIFTATPILISLGLSPTQNVNDTYKTSDVTLIYTDTTTYGSMITKITINANGNIEGGIPNQRIDFYIWDNVEENYNLLLSKYMTGDEDLQEIDPIPSVIFEFTEGLVIPSGGKLALSSTNPSPVSIIIEGGTYDQPA